MSERIREFAERYDTNKDGKISQQEIDQNRSPGTPSSTSTRISR